MHSKTIRASGGSDYTFSLFRERQEFQRHPVPMDPQDRAHSQKPVRMILLFLPLHQMENRNNHLSQPIKIIIPMIFFFFFFSVFLECLFFLEKGCRSMCLQCLDELA